MKKMILFFLIVIVFLHGEEKKVEKGWRFGEENKTAKTLLPKQKDDCCKKLDKLIKIAEKQLEVQKKILKILQDQFEPEPKEIVVNGKKCIANSSAECFQMPLTSTAKRIPVLKNWVTNPTRKNAKEWLRWQAKYLQKIFEAGYSSQFALAQWGEDAYPIGMIRPTFDTAGAYGSSVLKKKAIKNELNKLKDVFDVIVFFGKNEDLDLFAFDNIATLKKDLSSINFKLVFKNKKIKNLFEDASHVYKNLRYLLTHSKNIVDESLFKKFNIYTTPMIAIYLKKTKELEIVVAGRYSSNAYMQRIWNMLEYKKIVDPKILTDHRIWEQYGDYSSMYHERYYGTELNKTIIQNAYNKDIK